jgi:hypothetical protein
VITINNRDDEEEARRKKYIEDTKKHLREFYNYQSLDKKQRAEIDKKIADEQLEMWRNENSQYFQKEKELSEQV